MKHVGVFPALEDEMCDFGLDGLVVGPLARPARCAGVGGDGTHDGQPAYAAYPAALGKVSQIFVKRVGLTHQMGETFKNLADAPFQRRGNHRWPDILLEKGAKMVVLLARPRPT